MADAKKAALVLFAHGARDPECAVPFRALQAKVRGEVKELTARYQAPGL